MPGRALSCGTLLHEGVVTAHAGLVTRADREVAVYLGRRSAGHGHEEAFQHPDHLPGQSQLLNRHHVFLSIKPDCIALHCIAHSLISCS